MRRLKKIRGEEKGGGKEGGRKEGRKEGRKKGRKKGKKKGRKEGRKKGRKEARSMQGKIEFFGSDIPYRSTAPRRTENAIRGGRGVGSGGESQPRVDR